MLKTPIQSVVLGELTPLQLTINVPPAATLEELVVKVAAPVVGVGVATGVGVTFGVGVAMGVGTGVGVTFGVGVGLDCTVTMLLVATLVKLLFIK